MPQCTPSRVTFLTGQYPWRHGWVNHYDVPRWGHGVNFDSDANSSIAKVMKQAGYKTCIAGKWQINDFRLQPEVMNAHGFDAYCMWTGAEGGNEKLSQERYWNPYIHTKEGSKTYNNKFGEDVFTDFIIDFMKANQNDPMMIYYPMCLPHGPLTTTPLEPNAESKMDKHKAMVRYTDAILNKLLKSLDDLGIRDNTIVVWTTDNGTAGNVIGSKKGKLVRGGKTYLTENGVNEPFIVNCPGKVPEGVVSEALFDFTDLFPTFADIAQADVPTTYQIDGKSFKPVIFGEQESSNREYIMTMGSLPAKLIKGRVRNVHKFRDRAIRDENYKVYVDTLKRIKEIYDLRKDKEEFINIINNRNPEVVKVRRKFQAIVDELPDYDAQPKYAKLPNSLYDEPVEVLNRNAEKQRSRSNHSPIINTKK